MTCLSLATIHKVLTRQKVESLRRIRRVRKPKRYRKATPGERVQMDTCKIAPGLYRYMAVDDCTRYQMVRLYPSRTAANTLLFPGCVVDEMPFPVQRIPTGLTPIWLTRTKIGLGLGLLQKSGLKKNTNLLIGSKIWSTYPIIFTNP